MVSVEAHLVHEITCEGGIRNVPSKESLNQFTKRYKSYYNIARRAMQFAYIIRSSACAVILMDVR